VYIVLAVSLLGPQTCGDVTLGLKLCQ